MDIFTKNPVDENLLVYSSLVFLTNFVLLRLQGRRYYSTLFYLLTITSILIHGFFPGNLIVNAIDKIPIIGIVVEGGRLFLEILMKKPILDGFQYAAIVVPSFLMTIYLYYYGFCKKAYCYDPDKTIARSYHCLLHIIGSMGHHAIVTF